MPAEAIAAPPAPPAPPAAPKPATSAVRTPATSPSKPASSPSKPAPAAPAPAAKVTNPFDDSFADMDRFAEADQPEPKPPGAPKAPPKAAKPVDKESLTTEGEEAELEGQEGQPKIGEDGKPVEEKLGPDGKPLSDKPGKTPWQLLEKFKKDKAKLEQENAQLRAAMKPGELPKEAQEKFTALESRNKELEDEIRHVNYSKSKEFVEKYQKPYENAWRNAIDDLRELTVANEDGTSRVATAQDMIALSNMPLGQARATAKAWFGDSADDVMSHRRTIRDLSEKQNQALDDSKKNGGQREQQMTAEAQAQQKAHDEEVGKVWSIFSSAFVEKHEFLRPVEGETERNEKLDKAIQFVDSTLKKNINQAKTKEERDKILEAHAALRSRAIGFSVLKHENVSLKAKVEELEKSLAEFQGSEPKGGEPRRPSNGEAQADTLDGAVAGMSRYAT